MKRVTSVNTIDIVVGKGNPEGCWMKRGQNFYSKVLVYEENYFFLMNQIMM